VTSIFSKNYYNWYVKREKGIYALSDVGRDALTEFSPVIAFLLNNDGV